MVIKQHLIDPEICIRCNTCEQSCPIGAVSHDNNNYVVDGEKCNFCMDCISPCPTGAIDNWRLVADAWPLDAQFSWNELPEQDERLMPAPLPSLEAMEDDVDALIALAHGGTGGRPVAPLSASKTTMRWLPLSATKTSLAAAS